MLLIRHAESELLDRRLVGRSPHVGLTRAGRMQAARLPRRLHRYTASVAGLFTSPQRRAVETALPIGHAFGLAPQHVHALDEVDFGLWTGVSFRRLDRDPRWHFYNSHRDLAAVPGGESAADVEVRVMRGLEEIAALHGGSLVAVVTHAEVIRTAVLHCSGRPLCDFTAVTIDPASISMLSVCDGAASIVSVNDRDPEQ
jgi:probable phosphoglycerate mutase